MLIIREIHNRYHRTILEIKLEYDKKNRCNIDVFITK